MRVNRRSYLVLTGGCVAALAGCVADDDATDDAVSSQFAGEVVPDLPGFADTNWYHEDPDREVRLEPDQEVGDLPGATFEFSLINESDEQIFYNAYNRGWYKLIDGQWHAAPPQGDIEEPEFSLAADDERLFSEILTADNPATVQYRPGRYGFFVAAPGRPAALVKAEGIAPDLERAYSPVHRSADGDRILYALPDYQAQDDPARRGTVRVRKVDTAALSVIFEQLTAMNPIQTAVAEFRSQPDVSAVDMRVPAGEWWTVIDRFGDVGADSLTIEFDGECYEATYEPDEDPSG